MEEQKEYKARRPRLYRAIVIEPVINGWIVILGCRKIVYGNTASGMADLIADFGNYIMDPKRTETEMLGREICLERSGIAYGPNGETPTGPGPEISPHLGPYIDRQGGRSAIEEVRADQVSTEGRGLR